MSKLQKQCTVISWKICVLTVLYEIVIILVWEKIHTHWHPCMNKGHFSVIKKNTFCSIKTDNTVIVDKQHYYLT